MLPWWWSRLPESEGRPPRFWNRLILDAGPPPLVYPLGSSAVRDAGPFSQHGRPMLVMPYAHDRPDNAGRVRRPGIARTVARHRYTPARAAAEPRHLPDNPVYGRRAAAVGEQVRRENGVAAAGDALGRLLQAAWCGGTTSGGRGIMLRLWRLSRLPAPP
jgi:hypothetical protein